MSHCAIDRCHVSPGLGSKADRHRQCRYRDSLKKDLADAFDNFDEKRSVPLICNALSVWLRHRQEGIHGMEEPGQLCERFRHHHEHNVNRAGLSEETLVADDRKLAECLKSLMTELPFEIFLASVTKGEENGIASRYGQDLDRYPDDDEVIDHREWKMYRDEEEDMDNDENSPEPGFTFPVTERIKVFQTTKGILGRRRA